MFVRCCKANEQGSVKLNYKDWTHWLFFRVIHSRSMKRKAVIAHSVLIWFVSLTIGMFKICKICSVISSQFEIQKVLIDHMIFESISHPNSDARNKKESRPQVQTYPHLTEFYSNFSCIWTICSVLSGEFTGLIILESLYIDQSAWEKQQNSFQNYQKNIKN